MAAGSVLAGVVNAVAEARGEGLEVTEGQGLSGCVCVVSSHR